MNYVFKMIAVVFVLFFQPVNLSFAKNWNNKNKNTNNLFANQIEEILLNIPKPPSFDKKVQTRFGEFKYDELNIFQKWNWIFEYSSYCNRRKFKEIFKYLIKNKSENELIELILNSKSFTIADIAMKRIPEREGTYSHYVTLCNKNISDVYLDRLNNLVVFFKNYKMYNPEDNNLHQTIYLDWEIKNYNISHFRRSWVESVVPQTFHIELKTNQKNIGKNKIKNVQYLKDKIIFNYIIKKNYDLNTEVKFIFYKKSKKLNISFDIPDSEWLSAIHSGGASREKTNIWGICKTN